MRKLSALILSFAVIYGITLIPAGESTGAGKKTVTYSGINNEVMRALNEEISNAQTQNRVPKITAKASEVVKTEIAGKEKLINTYNTTFEWMKQNQILYRHQLSRSFEGVLKKLEVIEASEVEDFNDRVNSIINSHVNYAKSLKFSQKVVNELQERLGTFLNPLKVNRIVTTIPATTQTVNREVNFDKIVKYLENIKENKTLIYESHARSEKPQTLPMILLYLGGLVVGVVGFATLSKSKTVQTTDKADMDALGGTMKRMLKDLNYPVLICDTNFKISWENTEASKLELNPPSLQSLLSDASAMENFKTDNKTFSVKVEELKYKSGKTNFVLQMIPQTVSPKLFSNIANSDEIEKVLQRSLGESKDFRNLNDLVAENAVKMNYLFKVSAKLIDVDLDENLSECFIESNRLNEAVKEFMMANYHLIKDDANISGMYMRTSEKGQRFNLNCFIPSINKEAFATGEASRIFIKNLSGLESKFNLYQPRVSFRWISDGDTKGVDICMSLENKSELESILRESNA